MTIELAKRAVACKHWRWTLGMQLEHGRRVFGWTEDGRELLYYTNGLVGCFGLLSESECRPDLTDPATVGCLLALVREAQGDCTIWTMVDVDCDEGAWLCIGLEVGEIGSGYSEAHALVAALEAAP